MWCESGSGNKNPRSMENATENKNQPEDQETHEDDQLHIALIDAVNRGQPKIVGRLILEGADPSLLDYKRPPLHLACIRGDVACVRALTDPLTPIERNLLSLHIKNPTLSQNLEQRNFQGKTPLHIATVVDNVDIVRLLLRRGADIEARDGLGGRTALLLAVEGKCTNVLSFLLEEYKPCLDAQDYGGLTAYQISLRNNDFQMARDLVKVGASPSPMPESDSDSDTSNDSDFEPDEDFGDSGFAEASS